MNITKKVWKAAKKKMEVTYKGKPVRTTAEFSMETLKARRAWSSAFHNLKDVSANLK